MELKPGYMQTEAGVLPCDWKVKLLADLAEIEVGLSKPRIVFGKGCPVVMVQNLYSGSQIDFMGLRRVAATDDEIQRYRLHRGDVLFANASVKRDGIGYPNKFEGALEDVIFAKYLYRASNLRGLNPIYLFHTLRSPFCRRWIVSSSQTGTLTNLNKTTAAAIPIRLPPTLAEQEAIADALSDADALIDSLEQLIAKKRHLKQGAMQDQLTGNKRLPGFEGEWDVTTLGALGTFSKGSGVRKHEASSGELACIRYGEIYTRHDDYVKEYHSRISPAVATTAHRLRKGDLLFAGSGETREEIGKCVAFLDDIEAYAGGDIVILRPENVDPLFMGFYLNTPIINDQKASKGQGDAVVHISASALADIEIQIPRPAEQAAIAAILSDMDAEIAALEAKLAKARQVKQGMMQELLTGKTRLV